MRYFFIIPSPNWRSFYSPELSSPDAWYGFLQMRQMANDKFHPNGFIFANHTTETRNAFLNSWQRASLEKQHGEAF